MMAHATYDISAGKIEDINNKIKMLCRQAYRYPDDEYFFLKLLDMSRQRYGLNPKSHKKVIEPQKIEKLLIFCGKIKKQGYNVLVQRLQSRRRQQS